VDVLGNLLLAKPFSSELKQWDRFAESIRHESRDNIFAAPLQITKTQYIKCPFITHAIGSAVNRIVSTGSLSHNFYVGAFQITTQAFARYSSSH